MRPQVAPPELAALRRHWRRWTALVAVHARRRGAGAVDLREYEALHRELLGACRALGGAAGGARREFYQCLEELAGPWLTSRSLEQVDRPLLLGLLARCRRAERELRPPGSGPGPVPLWAAGAVAMAAAVTAVMLLVWNAGQVWLAAQGWLGGRWLALVPAARTTGEAGWWFAGGVGVALVAIVLVWRSGRITGL
jgi:hypothetical protein